MRGLLASPLGFLIGFSLGALGGGGSILAVPALVYAAGQSPSDATTTSLLVVASASLFALYGHWRAGRVRVVPGTIFGFIGIGGSLAGSKLNSHIDGDLLLAGFAVLIVVAAWRMLTGCPSCTRSGEAEALEDETVPRSRANNLKRVATIVGAGTAVGFLTGLFGVGGGFVIVPALTLALGFGMGDAIGTSLLVITINALIALAARGGPGAVDLGVAVPFTVAAWAGVASGVSAAAKLPAQKLLNGFAGLLIVVALYTGIQSLSALVL